MSTTPSQRELRLADAFVTLTDTLVRGFDVAAIFVSLAETAVELLEVTSAGLMLADHRGRLRVMAASSEESRLLELLEVQNDEGPCLDAHRSGQSVLAPDLVAASSRWPIFSAEARRLGLNAAYALPMRLRDETIGSLNLFHRDVNALSPDGLRLGQGLADVATIAILQHRAVQQGIDLNEQLQTALNSRIVIEQAKGVLAERNGVGMDEAFRVMRAYARSTNTALSDVARSVVAGEELH